LDLFARVSALAGTDFSLYSSFRRFLFRNPITNVVFGRRSSGATAG